MTKKLLNLTKVALLIFSISFLLGSCTKDNYIDNPTQWDVRDFVVRENMWLWDPVDECYYCEFTHNQLTNFVAENGAVTASTLIDATFRPLAFTTYFWDEKSHYVSETINFEYGANFIRFNITASDLFDNVNVNTFKPGEYIFKTTLIW
ncbi:hypothetical protein G7050_04230 [Dysgonomonas sp. HDW5A]|uniref:hypothetical protein n=1 Tax=Dysgonomonas sp. HDW5A TaxID=2714926 RepID=UPI001409C033|nr:hypothetical protein [Dysgonomonas sp. HDW5A]QIK59089.1 hypothetical protein G7050_04230 [Dysgonomonas sp. HDW5A]